MIDISNIKLNTGQIKDVPKNPRFIRSERFEDLKKSIQDFPEMLEYREIVCYDNSGELVVIGGNMRLRACKELGYKEVPVKILPKETDAKKLKAFLIKDNVGYGGWDMELLSAEWDDMELLDLGMEELDFGIENNIDIDKFFSQEEGKPIDRIKKMTCPHCGKEFDV